MDSGGWLATNVDLRESDPLGHEDPGAGACMASWTKRGVIVVLALVPMLGLVAVANPVEAGNEGAVPVAAVGVIGSDLTDATGPVDVVLRLSEPSLAEAVAPNATRTGGLPDQ